MSDDNNDVTLIEQLGNYEHDDEEIEGLEYYTDNGPDQAPSLPEESNSFEKSSDESFSEVDSSFETNEDSNIENDNFRSSNDSFDITAEEETDYSFSDNNEADSFNENLDESNSPADFSFQEEDSTSFSDENLQEKTSFLSEEEPAVNDTSLEKNDDLGLGSDTQSLELENNLEDINSPSTSLQSQIPFDNFSSLQGNSDDKKFKEQIQESYSNIEYTQSETPANPPFSIVLNNIKYHEDIEDILNYLIEFKVISKDKESEVKSRLELGNFLISQISEYLAIILVHKLRALSVDIKMGPSDEIFPPKFYKNTKGPIYKNYIVQNKREHGTFENDEYDLNSILLTNTSFLEGYNIKKYLGLASEHLILGEEDIVEINDILGHLSENNINNKQDMNLFSISPRFSDDLPSDDSEEEDLKRLTPSLSDYYKSIENNLKMKVLKEGGNGMVGVSYQLTPVFSKFISSDENKNFYKLSCNGSIVWVEKKT